MSLDSELNRLRKRYVAIRSIVTDGTRTSKLIGSGCRTLMIVACDGRNAVVYDSMCNKHKLSLRDLELVGVLNESGKTCRYQFDEESGWLQVLSRVYTEKNGDEVEEWVECFPWQQYAVSESEAVKAANRTDEEEYESGNTGWCTVERLF